MGGSERTGGFHRERGNPEFSMAPYREDGQRSVCFGQLREALVVDEHD